MGALTAKLLPIGDDQGNVGVREMECISGRRGYIMTLGTAEHCRGQGIGGMLLESMMTRLVEEMSCNTIELHMKVGNEIALRLYRTHGFVVTETLPQHYTMQKGKFDAVRLVYVPPIHRRHGCAAKCLYHLVWLPWIHCFGLPAAVTDSNNSEGRELISTAC